MYKVDNRNLKGKKVFRNIKEDSQLANECSKDKMLVYQLQLSNINYLSFFFFEKFSKIIEKSTNFVEILGKHEFSMILNKSKQLLFQLFRIFQLHAMKIYVYWHVFPKSQQNWSIFR